MKKQLVTFVFSLCVFMVRGQLPYTLPIYPYDSTLDVIYGFDTAYDGQTVPLTYSAYRPVGDSNCRRPLAVIIHGGAWVAGDKSDYDLVYLSREFARRGWFAVTTNYRMGNHKTGNYTMYALCNPSLAAPCAYVYDSSEVIRSNYRAQQDIKGLIRFLAARKQLDSTDLQNVFLIGESAGGFIALATAFTDRITEKPQDCLALAPAGTPDPDMSQYGCAASGAGLQRPDLGGIDGDLYTSTSGYTVRGVASFFGGVFDTTLFRQSGTTPRVYLFHQGSDVVVHYDYGRLLARISYECFTPLNICQPFTGYPSAFGGEAIRRFFAGSGSSAPVYLADIISNYEYTNDCFDNGHSVDDLPLRTSRIVDFFSQGIDTAANHTGWSCSVIGVPETDFETKIRLFPNPVSDRLEIAADVSLLPLEYVVYSAVGQAVLSGALKEPLQTVPVSLLTPGNYFIRFTGYNSVFPFVLAQ
jgi:acetyl esterase/lipase